MHRPVPRRADRDAMRARILAVAEKRFRRVGHHKTSVADIASELGMSAANVYRFFPSRDAINEAICRRIVNQLDDTAAAIACTNRPVLEKLDRLLTAIHHHNKSKLIADRGLHDLTVAALQEHWAIIKAHLARMAAIFEVIIREGIEAGELDVEDPAEAARGVTTAFMPSFHPMLLEHCVQHGEDTEANLREQIRFILNALAKPGRIAHSSLNS